MEKRGRSRKAFTGQGGATREALGQSESFLEFQEKLSKVAPVNRPVLLIGERGTGKELAASRLHFLSGRWQGPLVALNCAALSPTLIEAELFGYEKGAFTGAVQRRSGRFEMADGGTLFLDEIGNIPVEVQEKILRVVEYGSFERVGSPQNVEVDVRIIGATNANLVALVEENRFKQDLLDRLSFEVLVLPPLRERQGDILLLAEHFAARMAFEMGLEELPSFTAVARKALVQYSWPGNVRELKNVVERAVYRSGSAVISDIVFNPFPASINKNILPQVVFAENEMPTDPDAVDLMNQPFKDALDAFKLKMLRKALAATFYNQKKAAEYMGLTYHQFRGLYRQYKKHLI